MRQTFLPFALPDTDENEINEIADSVRSGWITTGPKTRRFEAEFARAVQANHAVAVNSCTAAMHLALEAIGLEAGDIVLTTPYTFAATAEVIRYFNAIPIFVDVEPDTLNIDPARVAQTIETITTNEKSIIRNPSFVIRHSSLVKAILPVHIGGLATNMDPLFALAARHNLAIIEDAAHAFPAKYKGRMIGSQSPVASSDNSEPGTQTSQPPTPPPPPATTSSPTTIHNPQFTTRNSQFTIHNSQFAIPHAVCFSFYATKTITTGEGGMITTGDETLAERCRIMALHGINRDAWKRYTAEGSWYYEITAPGYKYNMSDLAAAMGLAQLQKAERMWQRRREIAHRYNQAFGPIEELQRPANRTGCQHAWHLYILRLNLDRLTINRAQFIQQLKTRNIGTSVHFIPLHLHPYYQKNYGYRPEDFPIAYREYQRVVSLPIYSKMTDDDVTDVIEAVLSVVKAASPTKITVA